MSSLEDLVVSGREMDRELVAEMLAPYVRLDKDTRGIRPTVRWNDLTNELKLLLYLVARKAMKALDFPIEQEQATPSEIAQATGVAGGSMYPLLRELLRRRVVDQAGKRGAYFVPNHAMEQVKAMLAQHQREDK